MKLRLHAAPLAETVAYVARALPARPPVPVLAGILLATTPEGCELLLEAGHGDDAHATDAFPATPPAPSRTPTPSPSTPATSPLRRLTTRTPIRKEPSAWPTGAAP
ncbi:hypothetical protein [Kitasatospora sp. NPDC051914]|uniref:hypothetical protein n=1 Tax=Kitasatospora sp. NPDC051914 TaxID=3154945 RepID=UPI00342D7BA1